MRILDFFDGFSSQTVPIIEFVTAGRLSTYPDDASYEAAKGSVGEAGDLYFNTTDKLIRVHNGTVWEPIQTNFNIENERASGTVNGINVNFTLSFSPISEDHAMVTVNGVKREVDEYNIAGNTVTFNVAPETGAEVSVFYFYDGFLPPVSQPTGILEAESPITITASDILNKFAKLPSSPSVPLEPTKVICHYLGVGKIVNGEDFQIINDEIHWNGLGLDSFPIEENDRLDFDYYI